MVLSTMVLVLPSRTAWPSGSARCTSMTPSVPPAPPRFSMNTEPSSGFTRSAHCRPTMSFTPPAENGTTSLIGRLGNVLCAKANGAANAVVDAAMPSFSASRRFKGILVSLHFESEFLDDRRPACVFAGDLLLCRFGAGIQYRLEARGDHELLNLRIGHRGAGLVSERVDDVFRHAGRGEQAVEIRGYHARQSRLDGGRDVGGGLEPLVRGDRQDADFAGCMELQERPADIRRHHRNVARGEIG